MLAASLRTHIARIEADYTTVEKTENLAHRARLGSPSYAQMPAFAATLPWRTRCERET